MAQVRKNKKLVLNKFSSTKKEILGFFYIVLSVLFLLSIYSHDPNDPNFLNSGLASTVNNYIGVVGSYTSFLFFKFFGLFAYLLPIIFIFIVIILGVYELSKIALHKNYSLNTVYMYLYVFSLFFFKDFA